MRRDPLREDADMVESKIAKLSEALQLCQRELAQVRAEQEPLLEECSQLREQNVAAAAMSQQLACALAAHLSSTFWEHHQPTARIGLRRFVASRWPLLRKIMRSAHSRTERAELQQVRLIEASRLFRPDWYLQQNADVAAAGISPAVHYLRAGAQEGRDPGPSFSTRAYIATHPDVEQSGTNALVHYLQMQAVSRQ